MTDKVNPTTRPSNAFAFATVASARARQLQRGCVPKIEGSAKIARRAQQEVATGLVKQVESDDDESK
jgi:DNA-directed RNA polymerase subunit K/omega